MEHIAAVLLLVGCSGDLKTCTELPVDVSIYETYEECAADLDPTLASFKGARDKIFGSCVYVDPAMEEEDAELVWNIGADGRLHASVQAGGAEIANQVDHTAKTASVRLVSLGGCSLRPGRQVPGAAIGAASSPNSMRPRPGDRYARDSLRPPPQDGRTHRFGFSPVRMVGCTAGLIPLRHGIGFATRHPRGRRRNEYRCAQTVSTCNCRALG
jgi:hypothetical protein